MAYLEVAGGLMMCRRHRRRGIIKVKMLEIISTCVGIGAFPTISRRPMTLLRCGQPQFSIRVAISRQRCLRVKLGTRA